MKYNYSFPDFMQYAIDSGLDLREEGETLWAQTKQLPTELVKDLFFDAPHHISTFLNHTLTAVISALGQLNIPLSTIPTFHFSLLAKYKYHMGGIVCFRTPMERNC